MITQTTIAREARELEIYATNTHRYYPQLQSIEKVTQMRYDKAGEGKALAYATDALTKWLQAPARHYLQEVQLDDPTFRFSGEAIDTCARHLAECIVLDCSSGYYRP